jgi:hypothetical protein
MIRAMFEPRFNPDKGIATMLQQLNGHKPVKVPPQHEPGCMCVDCFQVKKGITQCPPPLEIASIARRKEMVDKLVEMRLKGEDARPARPPREPKFPKAKASPKAPTERAPKERPSGTVALVDICRELGYDAKISRAKMRRVKFPEGVLAGKHLYYAPHKQWVIDTLNRDRRARPRLI